MPDAPSGVISKALEYARAMLADCGTFQTLVGAANATEALDSIHYDAPPPPADNDEATQTELETLRPFAVVSTMEYRSRSMAEPLGFSDSATVYVYVEADIDAADVNDPGEYLMGFRNTIGALVTELKERRATAGFLVFDELTARGPVGSHPDAASGEGSYVWAELNLSYDVGGA